MRHEYEYDSDDDFDTSLEAEERELPQYSTPAITWDNTEQLQRQHYHEDLRQIHHPVLPPLTIPAPRAALQPHTWNEWADHTRKPIASAPVSTTSSTPPPSSTFGTDQLYPSSVASSPYPFAPSPAAVGTLGASQTDPILRMDLEPTLIHLDLPMEPYTCLIRAEDGTVCNQQVQLGRKETRDHCIYAHGHPWAVSSVKDRRVACTWLDCGSKSAPMEYSEYWRHLLVHLSIGRFMCNICQRKFTRADVGKNHVTSHKNNGKHVGRGRASRIQ
jgi:hypothetical protein